MLILASCLLICLVVSGSLLLRQVSTTDRHTTFSAQPPAATSAPTETAIPNPAVSTSIPATTPSVYPTTSASSPGEKCEVNYTVNTQWPGGFVATITITNLGSAPINNWILTFAFPQNQSITQGWNGSFSQTGTQVSIANAAYNARILPASSTNPGFQATWHTNNPSPVLFKLNGVICTESQ